MIRIGLLAALLAAAAAAYAQPQRPDTAVPSAATETRAEPPGVREPVPPRLDQSPSRPRSDVDARHCLDLGTNAQVHRCAEPFRPRLAQPTSKAPKK
jgi:hypothetical protein